MSLDNIAESILSNEGFKKVFSSLQVDSIVRELSDNFTKNDDLDEVEYDWNYLLTTASLLAHSRKGIHQEIALRIAQHALTSSKTNEMDKDSAAIVLDIMSNKPALNLATNREVLLPHIEKRLNVSNRIDWLRRDFEYSINTKAGEKIRVNKFQKAFWENASKNQWISVSAPTSAGKSYILSKWISETITENSNAVIVYLVPTRALISQVEKDIKNNLNGSFENKYKISTLPISSSYDSTIANIFIFTQERLQLFFSYNQSDITINNLIVDEAQKIGDGYRGVLLQQVIERLENINNKIKIVFASPFSKNPEALIKDAKYNQKTHSLTNEDVTVNQNLVWVNQTFGNTKKWDMFLCGKKNRINIGQLLLEHRPETTMKRLAFVAHAVSGNNPGNIIYVNGAADAEKISLILADIVEGFTPDSDINDLVELIEKTIHKKFLLVETLKKGIAFHYGNIPLLVREEIERLFSKNKIRYLICTSTLIEGVNMSCKNIFLRGPTKGRGRPMKADDFWNLAGRAGRWGKEFQGNIYCIDASNPNVWKVEPPTSRKAYEIKKSTESVLDDSEIFFDYIKEHSASDEIIKKTELEYVFSYFMNNQLKYGSLDKISWLNSIDADIYSKLVEIISDASNKIEIKNELIEKNPGISPFFIRNLNNYFEENLTRINELIPLEPSSVNAVESFHKIFNRTFTYLGSSLGPPQRAFALALLVTRWMNGYSLSRLIQDRLNFLSRNSNTPNVRTTIREVLNDVEQIARYEAPKYISCYLDVLREVMIKHNLVENLENLNDISIYLEFGVSTRTQLSLISLGLSRTATISLSEIIADDDLNEAQARSWVAENTNSWLLIGLPKLVENEIKELIS